MFTMPTEKNINRDKVLVLIRLLEGMSFHEWSNITFFTDKAFQKQFRPINFMIDLADNQAVVLEKADIDALIEKLSNEII